MTPPKVRIDPVARRDLRELTLWLHSKADPQTSQRFAMAVIASFSRIAVSPGIGTPVPSTHPALFGIRKWRISGFPKHLIFYRAAASEIRVIRVLHAAQNWWALLDVN